MREKQKAINFGTLVKSFWIIIDITKKVQSLVSLTILIMLRNLVGLKRVLIRHLNQC